MGGYVGFPDREWFMMNRLAESALVGSWQGGCCCMYMVPGLLHAYPDPNLAPPYTLALRLHAYGA